MANALLDLYYQGLVPQPVSMPPSDDPKTLAELGISGFGPVTQASRAGRMSGELRQGPPTGWEAAGQAVLDYGPIPAQETVAQFDRAGSSLAKVVSDPSLINATNAGVQTSMAMMRPVAAATSLGLGYGAALAQDLGFDPVGSAEAKPKRLAEIADLPGLSPEQMQLYRQAINDGRMGAAKRLEEVSNAYVVEMNKGKATAAGATALAESQALAAREKQRQQEYSDAVGRADAVREQVMNRDTRFQDTSVGQMYNELGAITPIAAAAGGGVISRLGTGPGVSTAGKVMKDYVLPMVSGTGFSFGAMNAPLFADMNAPASNPEKEAMRKYAMELPEGHPRKAEAAAYAESLPDANPVRTQAQDDFYDNLGKRLGVSAIEGITFGKAGANTVNVGPRIVNDMRRGPEPGPSGGPNASAQMLPRAAAEPAPQPVAPTTPAPVGPSPTPIVPGNTQASPARAQRQSRRPAAQISDARSSSAPSLSQGDQDKIKSVIYSKMQRDGSLEGLTARDLGVDLSGKGATPENIRAYIAKITSISDDMAASGIPAGPRQAALLSRMREKGVKFAVPGTAIGAASMNAGQDDFDTALNEARQILIDIDGDGIPDIAVPR